jgi:hypothetical protein
LEEYQAFSGLFEGETEPGEREGFWDRGAACERSAEGEICEGEGGDENQVRVGVYNL